MTNIAEILEFAPEGLKLYSTVHGEVKLKGITKLDDYPIELETTVSGDEYYDHYGKMYQECGECILFPSKDYYDWDDWQKYLFPQCVGSVIYCPSFGENGKYLLITEKCAVSTKGEGFYEEYELFTLDNGDERFATPEETEKFWEELDTNGYVFDGKVVVKKEKEWCIFDAKDGETEKKFTIEDFQPFDKVLVRDSSEECWNISMFSFTTGNTRYPYQCLQYTYGQCIPYNEETAHLLGTIKKYDGKYKTWKD